MVHQKVKEHLLKQKPVLVSKTQDKPIKLAPKQPVKQLKKIPTQQRVVSGSSSKRPTRQSGNILEDVFSTGMTVAKNISSLAEGNPLGLLEIPNSVLSVVDTTKNILRNVSQSDVKEKVILPDKESVNTVNDRVLINKLKQQMPVITTTQLPSSYSTEISQQPLVVTEKIGPGGRKLTNVSGSFSLGNCIDDNNPLSSRWNYSLRCSPIAGTFFGPRVQNLANTFQMWRFNSATASWVPTQGTDYVGNYSLNFMEGTDIASQYSGLINYQDVSQRETATCGTAKQGGNLTYRGKGDWLYVDDSSGGSDQKFFSSTTFGVLVYNYKPVVANNVVGFVSISFDIDFMSASEFPYSFNAQMGRIFRSMWVSHCRINLKYDAWLALVWTTFGQMVNFKQILNQDDSKEYASIYGNVNHSFIDAKKYVSSVQPAKGEHYQRKAYLALKKIMHVDFDRFVDASLESNTGLEETLRAKKYHGMSIDEIMSKETVKDMLASLLYYFRDSPLLDQSFDFFLKFMRDSLKITYRTFNPFKFQIEIPVSDEEDEEDEVEILEDYINCK
jgi:hypothetical protein